MSDLTNVFTDIADAIRAKTETQITYKPTEMANAINNIETGGGAVVLTAGSVTGSFNSPVVIPNGITNITNAFRQCTNFNQPVNIPDGVTVMVNAFNNCFNFNQPISLPNSITDLNWCFSGCRNFNQPVTIPENVVNLSGCFLGCWVFNQPVSIPANVNNLQAIFSSCRGLNSQITFPESFTGTMAQAFVGCNSYNHPVRIPQGVNNVLNLFADCLIFNQPVIIPEVFSPQTAYTFRNMFSNCYNLNQLVLLPSTAKVLVGAFSNCRNLNQAVIIPPEVNNIQFMFTDCNNFGADIIFLNDANMLSRGVSYMVENTNRSIHKRIICNNASLFMSDVNRIGVWDNEWQQSGDNYFQPDLNLTVVSNAVAEFGSNDSSLVAYNEYFQNGQNSSEVKPAMIFNDTVIDLYDCFNNFATFNSYVILGNYAHSMSGAFRDTVFNCPLIFPKFVNACDNMLRNDTDFGSTLFFKETSNLTEDWATSNMLTGTNNSKLKTIICDNAQVFTRNGSASIYGTDIEWTEIENGVWFNATVNTTIKQI